MKLKLLLQEEEMVFIFDVVVGLCEYEQKKLKIKSIIFAGKKRIKRTRE